MKNSQSKSERVTFSEQMGEFLRRNMNYILGAALTLLILQDIFGTHGLVAMRHSQKEAAQVQQEIDRVNEENGQLQENVKSLKSDPVAIERIAREEMGLARPGEYIFKIPDKSAGNPAANSGDPAPPPAPQKAP